MSNAPKIRSTNVDKVWTSSDNKGAHFYIQAC
jgi:hypothetical protein